MLKKYMVLDDFARDSEDGFYEVVSLYYDSPRFFYYYQKIDGVKKRKKVRLRTYRLDGSFANASFFEIKRKHDAIILKDRFLFEAGKYDLLMKDNKEFIESFNSNKVIEEFITENSYHCLQPKVLVSYKREPFVDRFNKNFKVTFDYSIKSRLSENLFYKGDNYVNVLKDMVVMEVKFNGKMAHYIHQIIKKYNLKRVAYSKYCHGLESCMPTNLN